MNIWKPIYSLIFLAFLLVLSLGCSETQNALGSRTQTSQSLGTATRFQGAGQIYLDSQPTWEQILSDAQGTQVRFHMWGGSDAINRWIDTFVAPLMLERYGVTLLRVPSDAPLFVNRLISEGDAERAQGTIDLMWINGENFRRAKESEILAGPITQLLPNFLTYVDPATAAFDFGFPTDGFEAPYGRAQFVFEYNPAVSSRPESFQDLPAWVRAHPGRFTYPEPQDFTGNAFIRQAFISLTGGAEQYLAGWDPQLYEANAPILWDFLRDLEPYLWQEGRTYPRDLAFLDTLFENQEVLINMTYTQAQAQARILQGRYPESVRTFVMEEGSLFNTHFTAVAFNSSNPAGALVLANLLMDPEVQLSKNNPENWGDFTVLDLSRLSPEFQRRFSQLDLGPATLPLTTLEAAAVPEIPSEYLEALQRDWYTQVLGF